MYFIIHEENSCHNSGLYIYFFPHKDQQRAIRWQTYHIQEHYWSAECVFPLISQLCYNSEILGGSETDEPVYFGVCCRASSVCGHWGKSTHDNALHGSDTSPVLFTVSWLGRNQPINLDFCFAFNRVRFFWWGCVLFFLFFVCVFFFCSMFAW